MRRRKLKDSMRNGKKRIHAETAAGWTGSSACLLVPLLPLFIRYRGRLDIPATDDSALSALDTDAQADTFNSLLIPWLLLLPPLTRRAGGGSHHSSSLYFEYSTHV